MIYERFMAGFMKYCIQILPSARVTINNRAIHNIKDSSGND